MRKFQMSSFVVLLLLLGVASQAQNNNANKPGAEKPLLFTDWPASIPVSTSSLSKLLNEPQLNKTAGFSTDAKTIGTGNIVSVNADPDNRFQSVVIKLSDKKGATLSISRTLQEDGSIRYRGRILSFAHGDCYELHYDAASLSYSFKKRALSEVVTE